MRKLYAHEIDLANKKRAAVALYNALDAVPLPSTMGNVETHYKLFYDWFNKVAQPALEQARGEA